MYVQSDILLFVEIFKSFRNKSLEIHKLDPAYFLSAKTEFELELLTNADMSLMTEKYIRGGTVHAMHRYAKVSNKCMKDYDQSAQTFHIMNWDVNNLYC